MSPAQAISALRVQVERQDRRTERQCAEQLRNIAWVLLSAAEGHTTYINSEQSFSSGRVDLIVFTSCREAGGIILKEAYIWELKAPQVPLYKFQRTENQIYPSKHLYDAETQLFRYHHNVFQDSDYLQRRQITYPDHVKFGGIIIGRDTGFVECREEDQHIAVAEAHHANVIRKHYIYERLSMQLWTWDYVLELAESQTASHQQITGDPDAVVDLSVSLDL